MYMQRREVEKKGGEGVDFFFFYYFYFIYTINSLIIKNSKNNLLQNGRIHK